MKFAAHDRGTARTLIRSSVASPSLESLPSRIGATERQTVARVVDLGIVPLQRDLRAVPQEEPRPLTPDWRAWSPNPR